jgi:plasmid stability protein
VPKTIRLRNVPDDLHRKLKSRAAMEGPSLSDYIIRDLGNSPKYRPWPR